MQWVFRKATDIKRNLQFVCALVHLKQLVSYLIGCGWWNVRIHFLEDAEVGFRAVDALILGKYINVCYHTPSSTYSLSCTVFTAFCKHLFIMSN